MLSAGAIAIKLDPFLKEEILAGEEEIQIYGIRTARDYCTLTRQDVFGFVFFVKHGCVSLFWYEQGSL